MDVGKREFKYFVLRYVPDAARGEFMNVGVILHESFPESGRRLTFEHRALKVSVLDDLTVLKGLDPHVDVDFVRDQLIYLQGRIDKAAAAPTSKESAELFAEISSYSNSVVLSPPRAISAYDADDAIRELSQMFLR